MVQRPGEGYEIFPLAAAAFGTMAERGAELLAFRRRGRGQRAPGRAHVVAQQLVELMESLRQRYVETPSPKPDKMRRQRLGVRDASSR